MQSRALEKYVWGVSFVFCFAMLMSDQARAGALDSVISNGQNPLLYAIGLCLTFVGAKVSSRSGRHF